MSTPAGTFGSTLVNLINENNVAGIDSILECISTIDVTEIDHLFLIKTPKNQAKLHTVRAFIADGRYDFSIVDNIIFRYICSSGDIECARELVKCAEVDPRAYSCQAMNNAIKHGHVEIVQLLLDENCHRDEESHECFILAVHYHRREIMALFLYNTGENGELVPNPHVDPSHRFRVGDPRRSRVCYNQFAVYECCNDEKSFQLLLKHPLVDPSCDDNHHLLLAMASRQADKCIILLSDQRCINGMRNFAPSVLRCAIETSSVHLAEIVLSQNFMTMEELRLEQKIVRIKVKAAGEVEEYEDSLVTIGRLIDAAITRLARSRSAK